MASLSPKAVCCKIGMSMGPAPGLVEDGADSKHDRVSCADRKCDKEPVEKYLMSCRAV